jgi:hypothetical protein
MKKLVGIILLLAVSPVWATQPLLIWCQGCTPDQQQAAALKNAPGNTVYVGDAVNKTVNAYNVYIDVEDTSPVTRKKAADQIAPNQQLVTAINYAIAFYNSAPAGWNKHLQVSARDFSQNLTTVYKIADAGPDQNNLVTWLNGGSNFGADVYLLTGWVRTGFAMFHVVDLSASPQLAGTVNFSDGSHINAYYDNATGKIKLDPSSAEDSHGNNVPYLGTDGKIHNLGGHHDFDPTVGNPLDQTNFINQLNNLHVPIILDGVGSGGSGGSGSSPSHWVCVYDDAHKQYTCTSD